MQQQNRDIGEQGCFSKKIRKDEELYRMSDKLCREEILKMPIVFDATLKQGYNSVQLV